MPDSFLGRLKERKLIQWAAAYLAVAWVVLEVSGFVVDRFGWPDVIGRMLIILAAFGFLLVLVLAWYHGEKGRQSVSGPELLIIALLLLVAGGVLSLLRGTREERSSRPPPIPDGDGMRAVAVLPCDNISPDPEDAYLADGIHEEILLRLTRISGLTSLGRKSVESYRGDDIPLVPQIASELGVGFVGECSVRKDPQLERIRLTFQLLDPQGTQLWAENYDRDLTAGDLFEIQTEVAQQVARAIGAQITPDERLQVEARPTENSAAYGFYLQGREYWVRPGFREDNWRIAGDLWTRAIELDPGFALARAKLSFLHGRMYFFSFDISPERLVAQEREAREALRLAPELPEAHFAEGYVHYVRGDLQTALESFDAAEARAPSDAVTSAFKGYAYRRLGDWDAWERTYLRTLQLNPRNADIYFNLGANTFNFLRRYDEAIAANSRALEFAPDFISAAWRRGFSILYRSGETDSLHAVWERGPDELNASQTLYLARLERDRRRMAILLETAPAVISAQAYLHPKELHEAWMQRLGGDEAAARTAFQAALTVLDSMWQADSSDFRLHGAYGFVYAGLGRAAEAAESAENYRTGSTQSAGDVFFSAGLWGTEAEILAQAGLAEDAVEILDRLLSSPGWITVPVLRIDPVWDPIRSDPGFIELLEKHGSDGES